MEDGVGSDTGSEYSRDESECSGNESEWLGDESECSDKENRSEEKVPSKKAMQNWSSDLMLAMAKKEKCLIASNCKFINSELHRLFPQFGIQAIKAKRKKCDYKKMLDEVEADDQTTDEKDSHSQRPSLARTHTRWTTSDLECMAKIECKLAKKGGHINKELQKFIPGRTLEAVKTKRLTKEYQEVMNRILEANERQNARPPTPPDRFVLSSNSSDSETSACEPRPGDETSESGAVEPSSDEAESSSSVPVGFWSFDVKLKIAKEEKIQYGQGCQTMNIRLQELFPQFTHGDIKALRATTDYKKLIKVADVITSEDDLTLKTMSHWEKSELEQMARLEKELRQKGVSCMDKELSKLLPLRTIGAVRAKRMTDPYQAILSELQSSESEPESAPLPTKTRTFKCHFCPKMLKSKGGYALHVMRVHSEEYIPPKERGGGGIQNVKIAWTEEETREVALLEAKSLNCRNINMVLWEAFSYRTMESIKCKRQRKDYRRLVEEYRSAYIKTDFPK